MIMNIEKRYFPVREIWPFLQTLFGLRLPMKIIESDIEHFPSALRTCVSDNFLIQSFTAQIHHYTLQWFLKWCILPFLCNLKFEKCKLESHKKRTLHFLVLVQFISRQSPKETLKCACKSKTSKIIPILPHLQQNFGSNQNFSLNR